MNSATNVALVFGAIWLLAFVFQLLSDVSYKRMRAREVFTTSHITKTASYVTTLVLVMLVATFIWRLLR